MLLGLDGTKSTRLISIGKSDLVTQLKLKIGTMETSAFANPEPLSIDLNRAQSNLGQDTEILNDVSEGVWGNVYKTSGEMKTQCLQENDEHLEQYDNAAWFEHIAKEQRMNTKVRQSIFVSIVSADDPYDARTRLLALRLNQAQILEVPRILVHCATMEGTHNHYYSLLSQLLCGNGRIRKAFRFMLREDLKRFQGVPRKGLQESGRLAVMYNLGRLYGHLIATESLDILVFKVLSFTSWLWWSHNDNFAGSFSCWLEATRPDIRRVGVHFVFPLLTES